MTALAEATISDARATYAEVRWWAVWLELFTASDLAAAMAVDIQVGRNGVRALLFHGICEETGEYMPGPYGDEPLVAYKPLPPGPRHHFTYTPEWRTCMMDLVPPDRGVPVRLWDAANASKKSRSTPGVRHKIIQRQRRYEEMERAKEQRRVKNRLKAQQEPKWRRRRGGAVITDVS